MIWTGDPFSVYTPRREGLHRRRAPLRPRRSRQAASIRFHDRHSAGGDAMSGRGSGPFSALCVCWRPRRACAAPRPHARTPRRAQRSAPAGETIAITNARILPVSGPAIERGTVVLRGGPHRRGRRRCCRSGRRARRLMPPARSSRRAGSMPACRSGIVGDRIRRRRHRRREHDGSARQRGLHGRRCVQRQLDGHSCHARRRRDAPAGDAGRDRERVRGAGRRHGSERRTGARRQ